MQTEADDEINYAALNFSARETRARRAEFAENRVLSMLSWMLKEILSMSWILK